MPNYSGIWTEQAVMQANGAGNWPNAPGAPTIGTATNTGDGGAVSVAFTAPTFAGLPAVITSYTVTSSPGGFTGTGASSPITVSGLTNGTAYTFTVQATNASGTGPASAASNSVTPTLVVYVEEVFSTYLYTGTGSAQTITNNIDLDGEGGLVWLKGRDLSWNHTLYDTVNGVGIGPLNTADTAAPNPANNQRVTAFNSNGFTLGTNANVNGSGYTYVSWTFREQAKFFDVVTWSGTSSGASTRAIPHNLGSTPGFIVVKVLNATSDWVCNHRSLGSNTILLNSTSASSAAGDWGTIDSSVFTVTNVGNGLNFLGQNYVAYLFAHDAGGFGLTGTDNVISCGSFTTDGSGNATVTLGYEPQWVLMKASSGTGSWFLTDNMRGMSYTGGNYLLANTSAAEVAGNAYLRPTATGFGTFAFGPGSLDYIYIAIRRGPMKVPTAGTSVFAPTTTNQTGAPYVTTNFPVDLQLSASRSVGTGANTAAIDRLRGASSTATNNYRWLQTASTNVENTSTDVDSRSWDNTGFVMPTYYAGLSTIYWNFRRAPGFFDEVCYTGTGSATTFTHNLGVVPELMIVKCRNVARGWAVYSSALGATKNLFLSASNAEQTNVNYWNDTAPTASVFTVKDNGDTNFSTWTYVNYLFATCAGISKVGSYTGTGTTQTINCGFTAGSRFVMIKRTDSTGDWYVWDSARGIIAGNDPYLLLNSTAAEVTNTDYVDTAATGFEISSTAPAAINANGGTFIFLAIA